MLKEPILFDHLTKLPTNQVGLAVLGYPIKHSISPEIHTAALHVLAHSADEYSKWSYEKIEVHPHSLAKALPILADYGYRGLNLTIPHKVEVLPHLPTMDEQARIMGAVNTLCWERGGWKGYNTDGVGLSRAIEDAFKLPLGEFNVVVLGAGGAARAAVAQCIFEGCQNIALYNRTLDRARKLVSALKENGIEREVCLLESFTNPFAGLNEPVVVINATALGLRPEDPSPVDLSGLDGNFHVYDMVYNPPVTQLLRNAMETGYPVANGLGMLVGQAARSLEIWSGQEVSVRAMSEAAQAAVLS